MKLTSKHVKDIKLVIIYAGCIGFSIYGLNELRKMVFAEQSGNSPESNATSRIKTAYDWLVAKGANYGSTDAGDWSNNWGTLWNRIMESATWEPDGTATAGDVVSGKTFYAGNSDRTQKAGELALTGNATEAQVADGATFYSDSFTKLEGTASLAPDYSKQSLQDWDDMRNYYWGSFEPNGAGEDNTDEEATWTNTAGDATTGVWKDGRTGLYWSANQGYHNDLFTRADCSFFSTTPRGAYTGLDTDCGYTEAEQGGEGTTVSAINVCGQLSLDADGDDTPETDWYLPSQKELMQAYIDGIFNQTNATFTAYEFFWSSSEYSVDPGYAWYVNLPDGYAGGDVKSNEGNYAVRCVRRD